MFRHLKPGDQIERAFKHEGIDRPHLHKGIVIEVKRDSILCKIRLSVLVMMAEFNRDTGADIRGAEFGYLVPVDEAASAD
jgi:hypothetical protein